MQRRHFMKVTAASAVLLASAGARGQQRESVRRLATLVPYSEDDGERRVLLDIIRQQLRELGWVEEGNLQIDERWTGGDVARAKMLAAELVGLKPDVIFDFANAQLSALAGMTQSILSSARPIRSVPAMLRVLKGLGAILPASRCSRRHSRANGSARVALLINPDPTVLQGRFYTNVFESSAKDFHVEPITATVHSSDDIEAAISAIGQGPRAGLIVTPDTFTETNGELIIALMAMYRIPGVFGSNRLTKAGALLS